MNRTQPTPYLHIIHLVTALIISLAVIVIPLSYYVMKSTNMETKITASLKHAQFQLQQIVTSNPEFWQYEIYRIEEVLDNSLSKSENAIWLLKDMQGDLLLKTNVREQSAYEPWMVKNIPVFDSHRQIATIEVRHSVASYYIITALISLFCLTIGIAAYLGIRHVPLKALESVWNQMTHQARHDDLTNLPNRLYFNQRLSEQLALCKTSPYEVAILSIDLDHFKDVNDTLGHAAGDLLLKKVVEDIMPKEGQRQILARLGGDEFAIILTSDNIKDEAAIIADEIIEKLSKPYLIDTNFVHIGASIGIAIATDETEKADELLKKADIALYETKKEGRNNYHFFHSRMNKQLLERKAIESELRHAIPNDGFELYFQPQFNLEFGKISGAEALIRWPNEEFGFISPQKFIPVAEMAGLIVSIDKWVLETACYQATKWQDIPIAVNISPLHFQSGALLKNVISALEMTGLNPNLLELEITEGVLLSKTDETIKTLKSLRSLGVSIAMDDFGTGYSSLSYMQRFPFDKIKIDRSFVSSLEPGKNEAEDIVRAIISMGHAMNMKVNAEGVETKFQADFLKSEKCQEVQGYLFGHPMKASEMTKLIQEGAAKTSEAQMSYSIAS